ncbi:MAG: enoyl-CoA hydratase/isomerase family protein [Zhongshania sp.]|jgi:2-(1,2-epoxy-1,2-dihydrophenyl)acetyl-CoA isomerase|nr:enoyl-CoA hydratase/isomerase family protein [Zhongshania sp.]
MTYESFELSFDKGLARLTLNLPQLGNALTETTCRELALVADELGQREDLRAVLLSGKGKHFCVGGDLSMFTRDLDQAHSAVLRGTSGLHMGLTRLRRLNAPIIACVQGAAAGGGVALLSHCDFVVAARSASFSPAYIHIGFSCDLGATTGLVSRMGLPAARRFLMLGETLGAEAAFKVGLVDELCEDTELVARTEALAIKLNCGPTRAYAALRQLLAAASCTPFETQLEDEAQALRAIASSDDAKEGIRAFTEKRSPDFRGR